jgi:hypothetical protein
MILTLDISTSITGWAMANKDLSELKSGFIDLRNKKEPPTLYEKLKKIQLLLRVESHSIKDVERIIIEAPAMMFNKGGSSAQTLSMLQFFNGMVSAAVYDMFGVEPEHIMPMSVRSKIGLKVPRELKKDKAKTFIAEWIEKKNLMVIKRTKHGNPIEGTFDQADALALLLYGVST